MFSPPTTPQVIALTCMLQSLELVHRLATTGLCPASDLETSIHSLLEQNPESLDAVYGELENLRTGLETFQGVLRQPKIDKNLTLLRYIRDVLYLQRKLLSNKAVLNRVAEGIEKASQQAQHFNTTHTNVLANLADLYQNTISTLGRRIQVQGNPEYLQQQAIANRIRALLFAAVRAAVLWQQLGGRRWHFIFFNARMLDEVTELKSSL